MRCTNTRKWVFLRMRRARPAALPGPEKPSWWGGLSLSGTGCGPGFQKLLPAAPAARLFARIKWPGDAWHLDQRTPFDRE